MMSDCILVVDDEPEIRRLVQEILEDENYQVVTAENALAARHAYEKQRPDLVLLDIWMPDVDGISLLKEWQAAGTLDIPVVMMSGHGTVETAVEATRLGAYDFIEKPVSMGKLLVTIERALQNQRLRQENLRLRQHSDRVSYPIGKSQAMQTLRDDLERIAVTDSCVLISGEPGSGKAVAARYLHSKSPRCAQPLVEVNLGSFEAQHVANQLFGSERSGSVTPGSFDHTAAGTLFLDDIADLDLATQARLQIALQDKRYLRVGGTQPATMDTRVVAATSQDLAKAVRDKKFREDLYYQLNVAPIWVPPLREHREDVPELINFYVDQMVEHDQLRYRKFTTGALNLLRNYTWPGNIRELKSLVQQLLILDNDQDVGEKEAQQILNNMAPVNAVGSYPESLFAMPLRRARDQFEKAYLEYHLQRTNGNVSELAAIADMERTHLYRKLKSLGINPKTAKDK